MRLRDRLDKQTARVTVGRRRERSEGGNTAILVAVLLVVLTGFGSLVVDIGHLFRVRNELQNAADAAALAAASQLDRTSDGIVAARLKAKQFAKKNYANNTQVDVRDQDIMFGYWHQSSNASCSPAPCFQAISSFPSSSQASGINAVQVTTQRSSDTSNSVALYLGAFVGLTAANVSTPAVALSGGPQAECGFPMVVPDCSLDEAISSGTCDYCMIFQDNNSDNAGWTSFDGNSVGGPAITDLIKQACYDSAGNVAIDSSTGECTGGCNKVDVGTDIKTQNGNLLSTGENNFCTVIQDILLRGQPPGSTATSFVVKVPVLESTDNSCDASQFSSYKTIAGWATMEIYGAKCGKGDKTGGVFAPSAPCSAPPSDKYIVAALRCDLDSKQVAGGGFFGLQSLRPRLAD